MKTKKITPILIVDAIEPVLPFWTERLGFQKTVEVPEGERLGFVILTNGSVELMYQTMDSIRNDAPQVLPAVQPGAGVVFIEVEDIDEVERAVAGIELLVPRRETFYGATEIFVRDPAGNVVGFAQMHQTAA